MLGRCPRTGRLGIATATRSLAVGARVPHVRAGLGAVAIMAIADARLGYMALRLLELGYKAPAVIEELVKGDPYAEYRQLGVIDADGFAAARTGKMNRDWAGHHVRDDYIVLGNVLTGEHVLDAMEKAFAADPAEDLEERLLRTIEAGRDAGGQHGGQQSAALLVFDDRPFAHVDLRVDVHAEPIGELRRVFDVYRPAIPYYNLRQVDARVPPLHDWLAVPAALSGPDRVPDALGRDRHLEVLHAQVREGVHDRVHRGPERRGRPALAAAPQAERVRGGRHLADLGGERGQQVGARHRVLHEGRGLELAALRVVAAVLPEGLAQALDDAAVGLPVHDQRVDGAAHVVHRGVADDLHHAGLRIHLDLAHRAAVREGRRAHRLVAGPVERPAQVLRRVGAPGGGRHLEEADGAVGAAHPEPPARELEIGHRGLEPPRREARALLHDLVRRLRHDYTAETHRASRV